MLSHNDCGVRALIIRRPSLYNKHMAPRYMKVLGQTVNSEPDRPISKRLDEQKVERLGTNRGGLFSAISHLVICTPNWF